MLPYLKAIFDLWKSDRYTFSFLGVIGCFAAYWIGKQAGLGVGDAAGWVQAIGSIGSILFAFYWGIEQEGRASLRAAETRCVEMSDDLLGVLEIAKTINSKIDAYRRSMHPLEYWKCKKAIVEHKKALDMVPIHQHPFSSIAEKLIAFRDSVSNFLYYNDKHDEMRVQINAPAEDHKERERDAMTSADMAIMGYSLLDKRVSEAIDMIRMRHGL